MNIAEHNGILEGNLYREIYPVHFHNHFPYELNLLRAGQGAVNFEVLCESGLHRFSIGDNNREVDGVRAYHIAQHKVIFT